MLLLSPYALVFDIYEWTWMARWRYNISWSVDSSNRCGLLVFHRLRLFIQSHSSNMWSDLAWRTVVRHSAFTNIQFIFSFPWSHWLQFSFFIASNLNNPLYASVFNVSKTGKNNNNFPLSLAFSYYIFLHDIIDAVVSASVDSFISSQAHPSNAPNALSRSVSFLSF